MQKAGVKGLRRDPVLADTAVQQVCRRTVECGLPTMQTDECVSSAPCYRLEDAIMHLTHYLEMYILLTYSKNNNFCSFQEVWQTQDSQGGNSHQQVPKPDPQSSAFKSNAKII